MKAHIFIFLCSLSLIQSRVFTSTVIVDDCNGIENNEDNIKTGPIVLTFDSTAPINTDLTP
ncbi:hypothetical protein BB561_006693, partial [Smittium simulii]